MYKLKTGKGVFIFLVLMVLATSLVFTLSGCRQVERAMDLARAVLNLVRSASEEEAPPPPLEDDPSLPSEPIGPGEESTFNLVLYFTDRQAADAMVPGVFGFVTPVQRQVPFPDCPVQTALTELVAGPAPGEGNLDAPLPPTVVLQNFTVADGLAELDFNAAFAYDHPGGVISTQVTVEALVYTMTELEGIDAVIVLVEGTPWADGYGFSWSMPIDRDGIATALHTGEEMEME